MRCIMSAQASGAAAAAPYARLDRQSSWSLTACAVHPLQKRHAEGGDGRGTPLQSAASTPASSSATIARGPLPAGVKEESSDPPSVDGDGAEAVVTSAFPAHIRASTVSAVRNSNGDMFTRTIGVKDSAAAPLAPEIMPVPPPRAAALAASATVARMAAAETAEGAFCKSLSCLARYLKLPLEASSLLLHG